MQNADFGSKTKIPKTCQDPLYKSFRVDLCKKPLEKTQNIREMRAFWKSTIIPKAIAHAQSKGYSPCKILTLGQKKSSYLSTWIDPYMKKFLYAYMEVYKLFRACDT